MASNKPSGITRDYGRRSYVEDPDKSHMDHMKTVTDFQKYQEALEKHSEWKRPYLSEDYQGMEYDWSPPFLMRPRWWLPYIPDDPTIGHPDIFDPVRECTHCAITCHGGYDCGWGWCHKSVACWLPGQNISRDFSWAIIAGGEYLSEVEYNKPLSGCIRFKTSGELSEGEKVTVKVQFTDGAGNICTDTTSVKCEEEDCCEPSPPSFTWDSSSDDTMLKNDSASVTVSGGCSPFSWQITGTGFSITAQTTGRSNTVTTDGTACGSADITVTDYCGSVTTGVIRCTEAGSWVQKGVGLSSYSGVTWCYGAGIGGGTKNVIVGKDQWIFTTSTSNCMSAVTGSSWSAGLITNPPCGSPWNCSPLYGYSCNGTNPPACSGYYQIFVCYWLQWEC